MILHQKYLAGDRGERKTARRKGKRGAGHLRAGGNWRKRGNLVVVAWRAGLLQRRGVFRNGAGAVDSISTATVQSILHPVRDSPPSSVSTNGVSSPSVPASSQSSGAPVASKYPSQEEDSKPSNEQHVSTTKDQSVHSDDRDSASSGGASSTSLAKPLVTVNVELMTTDELLVHPLVSQIKGAAGSLSLARKKICSGSRMKKGRPTPLKKEGIQNRDKGSRGEGGSSAPGVPGFQIEQLAARSHRTGGYSTVLRSANQPQRPKPWFGCATTIKRSEENNEHGMDPVIPGLSGPRELSGARDGNGGDDWDSDSEDDLQIVLNDNTAHQGPMGAIGDAGGEDDDDEDGDPLVIVADGDSNQPLI